MKKTIIRFDRRFRNDIYELLFQSSTGLEILQGINGNPDPFSLCLPSLLDVGVMGTCQNRCTFCYQGRIQQPNMKLSDFMSIIDYIKVHTNQVALGGRGDPNKHPHFKEMLEYCRKNNVVPNYTTSGIDLTEDEIEISKMCGAVAVSEYEKDFTYNAIQKFLDAGIKTNIHQILHKGTFNKCLSIIRGYHVWKIKDEKSREIGSLVDMDRLNAVIFLLFKPQGSGKELLDLVPYNYQLMAISDVIFKPSCKFKIGMDSCLANHVLKYTTPTPSQAMSIDTCEAARMSGYITPDMKFKPCSFADSNTEVDLRSYSISKIWNLSNSFNNFRDSLKENPRSCPIGF